MNPSPSITTVRIIDDHRDLEHAWAIRRRVFHHEQNVDPSADLDGKDDDCVQFLAYIDETPVGTCRLQLIDRFFIKMQRLAVDSQYRGRGIGSALLASVASYVRSSHPELVLIALAQLTAVKPYEKAGWSYANDGDDGSAIIYEQRMAHKMMVLIPETREDVEKLELVKKSTAGKNEDCEDEDSKLVEDILKTMKKMNRI